MPVNPLQIIGGYDKARFTQFSPADCANWYIVQSETGKRPAAMYPAMGRRRISTNNVNLLIFDSQPRKIFKSIDYVYAIEGNKVWRINKQFSKSIVANSENLFTRTSGTLNFAYLPTITVPIDGTPPTVQNVYCALVDGESMFVIDEKTNVMTKVDDPLRPPNPTCIAAFGNRFVVSSANSTQFQLTQINLGGTYNPTTVFNVNNFAVFAQESGLIRQFAVLQNQLYMFTDFTTGIWSATQSSIDSGAAVTTFPWRKNTSFEFNFGIADPDSLDVDFGMIVWLAQNRNGLVTFMMSQGQSPVPIATQPINVLLQSIANAPTIQPLLNLDTVGFLYQYEDMIFYRASIGEYIDYQTIDDASFSHCLEYNFTTKTWHRNIEANGQRNRIEEHEFFNNKHLVTVEGQSNIYEMAGNIYYNEIRNPDPNITDPQDEFAFLALPMRYERVTPIISAEDYSEFMHEYIEIDFVFGLDTFIPWEKTYQNTVFIIGELPDASGNPVYMVAEDGVTFIIKEGTATPQIDEPTYSDLFKPHIELYISNDGGMSYFTADLLEFSPLGVYQWRMRWYQGGPSRNRVYKLVAVSAAPIVVLGAVTNERRISGGAN